MALYMILPLAILAVVTVIANGAPAPPDAPSFLDFLRKGCCPKPTPDPCNKCPKPTPDPCNKCPKPTPDPCGCEDDDDDDDCGCRRRRTLSLLANYYRRGANVSLPNESIVSKRQPVLPPEYLMSLNNRAPGSPLLLTPEVAAILRMPLNSLLNNNRRTGRRYLRRNNQLPRNRRHQNKGNGSSDEFRGFQDYSYYDG